MKKISHIAMIIICFVLALPCFGTAANITYQTTLPGFEHYSNYKSSDPASPTGSLDTLDISGLSRFDTSLGKLQAIGVGLSVDHVGGEAGAVGIGNGPVEVTGFQGYRYELSVTDSVTNIRNAAPMELPSVFERTDELFCSGNGCIDSFPWSRYELYFYNAEITSLANPVDFTGVGPIDPGTLTFGVAYPESLTFVGDGEAGAWIWGSDVDVWLTYHYSIPLPGTVWMLAPGVGLILGFGKRRKGDRSKG